MTKTTKNYPPNEQVQQSNLDYVESLETGLNSVQKIQNMNINEPRIKLNNLEENKTHLKVLIIFACNIIHYSLQVFTMIKVLQNHFT